MKKELPAWAFRPAGPEDHSLARQAHSQGRLQIRWPESTALRGWVKRQGWPAPRLGFEAAFITEVLKSEANFELALSESGIELRIPKTGHTLSAEELGEFDAWYAARSANGRPTDWGTLVEALREIRRAVEAGVAVSVEGAPPMRTWQDFYAWAHGRYHALEDGYDSWIGDDA